MHLPSLPSLSDLTPQTNLSLKNSYLNLLQTPVLSQYVYSCLKMWHVYIEVLKHLEPGCACMSDVSTCSLFFLFPAPTLLHGKVCCFFFRQGLLHLPRSYPCLERKRYSNILQWFYFFSLNLILSPFFKEILVDLKLYIGRHGHTWCGLLIYIYIYFKPQTYNFEIKANVSQLHFCQILIKVMHILRILKRFF